jgi:Zn-finger protein
MYLYEGTLGELEYLGYISNCADCVLIKDTSNVQVNINHIRYGVNSKLETLIEYFKEIERKEVDSLKI